jgi:hypothetical protein
VELAFDELSELEAQLSSAGDGIGSEIASLQQVGMLAADVSDERNYTFQDYTVQPRETLVTIARKMQEQYNVPEADMVALIRMFNEVTTRTRSMGTRRPSIQEVSNAVLRIPVPQRAGDLIESFGASEQLRSERGRLLAVREQQQQVLGRAQERIEALRGMVGRMVGLRTLALRIEENMQMLGNGRLEPVFDDPAISAEEAAAWRAFSDALNGMATDDLEEQAAARRDLEAAVVRLKAAIEVDQESAFQDVDLDTTGTLEWYERFRERYGPAVD